MNETRGSMILLKIDQIKSFKEFFWHLGRYQYLSYSEVFLHLFKSYVNKTHFVLDAGVGPHGGNLVRVATTISAGVGLDISHKIVTASHKKSKLSHNLMYIAGDIQRLPFRPASFDVIVCCDVLEHSENPAKAIEEVAFCLKKGGRFFLTTSNGLNPILLIDRLLPESVSGKIVRNMEPDQVLFKRYSRVNWWSLKTALEKQGLAAKELAAFGYPPLGYIHHFSKRKPPFIYNLWVVWDKLTKTRFLGKFKEELVAVAEKL